MDFAELLEEDLISELAKLRTTPYDDKEYGTVLDTVVKLTDRKIEMDRVKNEKLFKELQRADELKDRRIRYAMDIVELAVLTGTTVWGVWASFEFEKTGTVTTIMGRGFVSKLIPKSWKRN